MPAPQDDATVGRDTSRSPARPLQARLGRIARLARANAAFTAVLAVGAVLRLLTTLAYRPAVEFVQDSFDYLGDAHRLSPGVIRPLGYPLFLRLLTPLHELALVPAVQHVLGLAMGLMIYALLRRLGARPGLAALGAAPIVLDPYQIYLEQFVMAETLYETLSVAAVVTVLWRRRPTWLAATGAGALLAGAALTRVVGVFLLVPLLLVLVLRRAGLMRVCAVAGTCTAVLGAYGLWFKAEHGATGLEAYRGYFLAGRVAFIADCKGLKLPPVERPLCRPPPPGHHKADWYIWSPESPLRRPDIPPGTNREAMADDFALRVIRHEPRRYLELVVHDTLHFFTLGHHVGTHDWSVASWQFRTSFRPLRWRREIPPADPYVYQWTWPGDSVSHGVLLASSGFDLKRVTPRLDTGLARLLRNYQRYVFTPGPLLAAALVIAVAGAAVGRGGDEAWARSAALLLGASGLVVVAVPAATAIFDYRYQLAALPLLPPAGVVGWTLIEKRLADRRHRQVSGIGTEEQQPAGGPPEPEPGERTARSLTPATERPSAEGLVADAPPPA